MGCPCPEDLSVHWCQRCKRSLCLPSTPPVNPELLTSVQEPSIEVTFSRSSVSFDSFHSGPPIRPLCPQVKDSWGMVTSKPPTNGSRRNMVVMDQSTGRSSTSNCCQRSILCDVLARISLSSVVTGYRVPLTYPSDHTGCGLSF